MGYNDLNVVLYVYDTNNSTFTKAGTITKKFYVMEIEPKISFGSPEREECRDATIQKLFNLNALNFVDVFEQFNNNIGLDANNIESSKKFANILKIKTQQTGSRCTFANILAESYHISKDLIIKSGFFHHAVIAEPLSEITMQRSGKGELFLCFYGNGVKGKCNLNGCEKGDVYIDGTLYEVKKNQGRLLPGIKIKPTREVIQNIVNDPQPINQINLIVDMVHKAAGDFIDDRYCLKPFIEMKLSEILDVLKYNLNSEFTNLYLKFITKIIGIVSLLAYKKNHGFDRLILFEITQEVEFVSFNFDEELTIEQLFNIPGIKYKLDYTSTLGHQIDFI